MRADIIIISWKQRCVDLFHCFKMINGAIPNTGARISGYHQVIDNRGYCHVTNAVTLPAVMSTNLSMADA